MSAGSLGPQYLSESSVIIGARSRRRVSGTTFSGWAEAGKLSNICRGAHDIGAAIPDYRGGLNFAKGFGSMLGTHSTRRSSTKRPATPSSSAASIATGCSIRKTARGELFTRRMAAIFQLYANADYVHDLKNQYWANTVDFGPGGRMHLPWMPPGVYLAADYLRGVYTQNKGNPRRPNYTDFRLSFWYAASR